MTQQEKLLSVREYIEDKLEEIATLIMEAQNMCREDNMEDTVEHLNEALENINDATSSLREDDDEV